MTGQDVEIRKLPAGEILKIATILECGESWKQLMSIIPSEDSNRLKYNFEHMKLIEFAGSKEKRLCSEILLDEWGTSGRVRPTLSTLAQLLVKAQLFRAADYVTINLLQTDAPERPSSGPAAPIAIPSTEVLERACGHAEPSAPPLVSSDTIVPAAPPLSLLLTDGSPSPGTTAIMARTPPTATMGSLTPPTAIIKTPPAESTVPLVEFPTSPQLSLDRSLLAEETVLVSSSESVDFEAGLTRYGYRELEEGCQGWSVGQRLGSGAFGEVFLCSVGATRVAVKRLFTCAPAGLEPSTQVRAEVRALSAICHPNILSLVGYSTDGPAWCLVYDYMSNGSLLDRIHCKGGSEMLSWRRRLEIAIGSARGIQHLHTQPGRPLVHRDVKSANILLDQDMNPKVADFGLMRQGPSPNQTLTTAITTTVVGTSAYMAPEAFRGYVSVKMDVFSFGVVLLELITGLPPFDENREGCDLASHVDEIDDIEQLIDRRSGLSPCRTPYELYDISRECLLIKKNRPVMAMVLEKMLELPVPPE